ncbi:hypothetical protein CKALI_03705 [Corynebacterium kalinowskii]|uniref:Uncharacterized protein n=1 Tax=Corynebacterium kalinowskii TaxID=2675216 RepID=A0A6B8V959_9CORY|nr:hypothetical protein [Corynebacterium kalinowskii]QGU01622.1 hypothetical protein CKALI_03705 [Corynebacterium kalinowskii]
MRYTKTQIENMILDAMKSQEVKALAEQHFTVDMEAQQVRVDFDAIKAAAAKAEPEITQFPLHVASKVRDYARELGLKITYRQLDNGSTQIVQGVYNMPDRWTAKPEPQQATVYAQAMNALSAQDVVPSQLFDNHDMQGSAMRVTIRPDASQADRYELQRQMKILAKAGFRVEDVTSGLVDRSAYGSRLVAFDVQAPKPAAKPAATPLDALKRILPNARYLDQAQVQPNGELKFELGPGMHEVAASERYLRSQGWGYGTGSVLGGTSWVTVTPPADAVQR